MPRQPKKAPELWDAQKEHIHAYYINENKTLSETMDLMRKNHDFDATKKEYVSRLASWKMSKNLKKDDWKLVHARNSAQKQTTVLLNDREISLKRLKRASGRYGFIVENSFESAISACSSTRGLEIRTPPVDPTPQASMATIPWFRFQSTHGPHLLSMVDEFNPSLTWFNVYGPQLSCYSQGDLSMRGARSLLAKVLHRPKTDDDTDPTPFILQRLPDVLPRNPNADSCFRSNEPFFLLIQCFIYLSSNNLLIDRDMDRFLTWILESGSAPIFNQFIGQLEVISSPTFEIFLTRLLMSAVHLGNADLVSTLLRHNVDPNCNNSSFVGFYFEMPVTLFINQTLTPLQLAIFRGNDRISRLLIAHRANLDAVSHKMPFSPLELAISVNHGNFPIAEMLITSGADIGRFCALEVTTLGLNGDKEFLKSERTERTLLMKAVEVQNLDITRLLLSRGAPVNEVSCISGTALQIATMKNDPDLLQLLLRSGAKVNIVDELETSARRFLEHQVERWVSAKHDKDEKDFQRRFLSKWLPRSNGIQLWASFSLPIQIAARKNEMRLVQRLLAAGATVTDCPDWERVWKNVPSPPHQSKRWRRYYQLFMKISREWFQSAVHHSAENGSVDLATLLLDRGAEVNSRNASGMTPLQLACGLGYTKHSETAQIRMSLARLLLSRGAEVNSSSNLIEGTTALRAAAERGDEELVALLLARGADINALSSAQGGLTALQAASREAQFAVMKLLIDHGAAFTTDIWQIGLYAASSKGDLSAVEQFLEQDVNVNALSSFGGVPESQSTILQASIKSIPRNMEVTRKLIDAGADVNMVVDGGTALCTAVRLENRDALILLLSHKAEPNLSNSGITPLAIAAANGDKAAVECLIQAGADVNQLSQTPPAAMDHKRFGPDFAATPLWWTWEVLLEKSSHKRDRRGLLRDFLDTGTPLSNLRDVIDLLSAHGADPNGELEMRITLWCACHGPNISLVEMLLKSGANPNMPGWRGEFPIQRAAQSGNKKIVQLLLAAGADFDAPARESDSRTAVECAFFGGNPSENTTEREEVVRILIKAGAQIRDKGVLLARAMECRLFGVASDLMQDGADINCLADGTGTPLHHAVQWHRADLVRLLIDRGADVKALSSPRWYYGSVTALQFAAICGDFNIAKLLIENGADINASQASRHIVGSKGETALQIAADRGNIDIVHLLLENDTEVDMIQQKCKEAAVSAEGWGHHVLARLLRDYDPQRD